ncbi:LAMI_0A04390g1_1 [Lachancea mirantina]|uniref:LAMI_0A04390g1_1 n=1 Tax=Lachancea mirantina TaxID=1230905 RepID=A0A1G4IP05_9SACH|nr:LAMI_0A04390g1_1 [Lachancea mirantina]
MASVLCVPLKKTLHLDLGKHLGELIDQGFYQSSSSFEQDLKTITQLREAIETPEVSEKGLNGLIQYYTQFVQLKNKFPVDQIEFTWFETLGLKSYGKKACSFGFEEANILFNIGSMLSLLAAEANDTSLAGYKKMCLYLQQSAGCFERVLECDGHVEQDTATILALENLMLAQAQEIYWIQAAAKNHKQSLISRLALQVGFYYRAAKQHAERSQIIRGDWETIFKDKALYFEAVSDYRQSIAYDEKEEHGLRVSYLRRAFSTINTIIDRDDRALTFQEKINATLKQAERDNDLIYLMPVVPNPPILKPARMVTACIPAELGSSPNEENSGVTLFRDLLPVSIMENAQAFSRRQSQYIDQHVTEPLKTLTRLLRESLPMTKAIDDLKPVPIEEFNDCEKSVQGLSRNSDQVEAIIQEIKIKLEENFHSGESQLSKSDFQEKVRKLKLYLGQGRAIDKETTESFSVIDKYLLTKPIKLPSSNDPLVRDAAATIKRRYEVINEIRSTSESHPFLPLIISAYKQEGTTNFENAFQEHLKFCDDALRTVQIEKQNNKKLISMLKVKQEDAEDARLDPVHLYIQDFNYSMRLYEDVKENLKGGVNFYQDLMRSANAILNEIREKSFTGPEA